ncbi:hypothetical protein [Halorarius halobius]|uniref:hypothetical protein n=1 Tax=Halorarius halobius TaxID=2962671 RepID=UPI0020CE19C0|nr:hypothetical protein [Halorarius halobius]
MSADGPGRREVAHRLFAAEFDDADFSFSESDEERAPNYVVTPTGARVNRLFVVGVLTEVEQVNEEMLRGRVVDPTGAFVVYAGQYQPDALAFLERADPPAFIAVTGKARTFQPDDSDRVFTSIRPESISEVDAGTRDRWVVQAAERTLERVGTMAAAIESGLAGDALREALEADGVDPALAQGIPLALDHYGTTPDYLRGVRDLSEQALETVAGDRDEVETLDIEPSDGDGDAGALADRDLDAPADVERETDETDAGVDSGETTADAGTDEFDAEEAEPAGTADETEPSAADDGATGEPADEPVEPGGTPATADAADSVDAEPETVPKPDDDTELGGEDDGVEDEIPSTELDDGDDIGEFEPDEEFDPDDEVLSEEERAEAEELGGFSTGNEVEEPDEADAPEPEPEPAEDAGEEPEREDASDEEPEPEPEPEPADEDAGDVDLDEAVMDAMEDLDDGDGAEHDAIVEAVVDRTGAEPEAVEEAIQDALMSGQCYEPDDDVFKPI